MTSDEHILLIIMLTKQLQLTKALVELVRSRGVLDADDLLSREIGSPLGWKTELPSSGLAGNDLLAGLTFAVPATSGLPGGIKDVIWQATFSSNTSGLTVNWQWGAAVYTNFSTKYNDLGVKPVDDNKASKYKNSDHAGTPEDFKAYVIGGARGGGGSNFTGSYSATGSCALVRTPSTSLTVGGSQ